MNILIIGSTSSIANELLNHLKSIKKITTYSIGRKKLNRKNHFTLKNYNKINLIFIIKYLLKKKIKFDAVIIFNGYQKFSTLSYFNKNLFNKIIKINVTIPFEISSLLIKNNIMKNLSSVLFVGSIASDLNEVGNAYYTLAKSILNRSINLYTREQKKKIRFNVLSLGMVKNKMSEKMIKDFPGNFKNKNAFINIKTMVMKFTKILFDKKINNKIIKIHGKYEN